MLSLEDPSTPPKKDLTTPKAAGVPCSSDVRANGPGVDLEEDWFRRKMLPLEAAEDEDEDDGDGEADDVGLVDIWAEDPLDPFPPPILLARFPPKADRSLEPRPPSDPPLPLELLEPSVSLLVEF